MTTGHWEFTYGMERAADHREGTRAALARRRFAAYRLFVAQNVKTTDFGDPVFEPYVIRNVNGVPVAIIGCLPYTPIANPRWMVADWSFGIQDDHLQKMVDEARQGRSGGGGAVAQRHGRRPEDGQPRHGIDAIFGGHTHDGVPLAIPVANGGNGGGKTLVTNAGSNGKFLGVIDFDVKDGKVADFRYRLLPVFANQLQPDRDAPR